MDASSKDSSMSLEQPSKCTVQALSSWFVNVEVNFCFVLLHFKSQQEFPQQSKFCCTFNYAKCFVRFVALLEQLCSDLWWSIVLRKFSGVWIAGFFSRLVEFIWLSLYFNFRLQFLPRSFWATRLAIVVAPFHCKALPPSTSAKPRLFPTASTRCCVLVLSIQKCA